MNLSFASIMGYVFFYLGNSFRKPVGHQESDTICFLDLISKVGGKSSVHLSIHSTTGSILLPPTQGGMYLELSCSNS